METVDLLACAAIVFGGIGVSIFIAAISGYVRDKTRMATLQKRAGSGGLLRRVLRKGVPVFNSVGRFALHAKAFRTSVNRLGTVLRLKGFDCNETSLASLACAAFLALLLTGGLLGSMLAGVAFSVFLYAMVSAWATRSYDQHRDCIREALPDAVRAMSACFHAGYTLQQTFDQLQRELPGPVGDMFGSARDAMETGSTAKEALAGLRGRGSISELSFVSVALEVQHRAGGSMRHVLAAACESLESELELRRSLRVHTAQARLSARVVTGVTVGLVGVLSLLSEDFLAPFFASALGLSMLAAALCMQVAGIAIVRKMLQVEVD